MLSRGIRLAQITLLASGLTVAGCVPVYIPPQPHVPMFDRKGEFSAAFYAGSVAAANGNVAYAVSDKFYVAASGLYNAKNGGWTSGHATKYAEAGVGYFKGGRRDAVGTGDSLSATRASATRAGGQRSEVLLSVGYGSTQAVGDADWGFWSSPVEIDAQYRRYAIQASIGTHHDMTEIGLSIRFSYLDLYRIQSRHFAGGSFEGGGSITTDSSQQSSRGSLLFVEPNLFYRFGPDPLKLEVKAGLGLSRASVSDIDNAVIHFAFGLFYRI